MRTRTLRWSTSQALWESTRKRSSRGRRPSRQGSRRHVAARPSRNQCGSPPVGRSARRWRPGSRRRAAGDRATERRRNKDTTWAGVGGIVGYFWHNIPKRQLQRMSDLLESGQAALVVVALDHSATGDRSTVAPRHPGDRRRDRRRRHRAGLRGGAGARATASHDHDAALPRRLAGPNARRRRWTISVIVLPATMHTTFVANTSSAPRPPWALPSPTAHPMYAAAGMVVTEMATPTAALPRSRTPASPPCQRPGQRERRPVRPRSATARARCRPAPSHRRCARRPVARRSSPRRSGGHPKADAQGERGTPGQQPSPLDESHGGRRDGEQVRAQGHRPDHED